MVRFLALATLLILMAAGCGKRDSHQPAGHKVWGKVTLDGQPVPKGSISFEPEDPALSPSGATFQADGGYEVRVPSGRYKVHIGRFQNPPPQKSNVAPAGTILVPLTKRPLEEEITGPRELNFQLKWD